jgi:dipeptidyl aminopeptidase/acylaminoacyl peptidase
MRALLLVVSLTGFLQAPAAPPQPAPAPLPGTDIYLVPIAGGPASMKTAKPSPVSVAPGYDNQPNFSPDGNRILFAANRDGKQIDVYAFDRANRRVTQLTQTAENENSPTFVPAGAGDAGSFTVVQSEFDSAGNRPVPAIQRLWRFNAEGKSKRLILDLTPVGYHAWMDADRLVLFVLGAQGKPATLQIASVKTGKGEIAADGPGRSLHRIPGTPLASFVQREASGEFWVKQIDITTKKIDPLVKAAEGSSDRDMAWMPDGKTILMSSGTKVFAWTRSPAGALAKESGATGWTEVFDGAVHKLGAVSRLAVSPKGDAVVIVVAELPK